jgi:hypothetical protein
MLDTYVHHYELVLKATLFSLPCLSIIQMSLFIGFTINTKYDY